MEKPSNTGLFWAALAGLAAAGGVYTWQRLRQFAPARPGDAKDAAHIMLQGGQKVLAFALSPAELEILAGGALRLLHRLGNPITAATVEESGNRRARRRNGIAGCGEIKLISLAGEAGRDGNRLRDQVRAAIDAENPHLILTYDHVHLHPWLDHPRRTALGEAVVHAVNEKDSDALVYLCGSAKPTVAVDIGLVLQPKVRALAARCGRLAFLAQTLAAVTAWGSGYRHAEAFRSLHNVHTFVPPRKHSPRHSPPGGAACPEQGFGCRLASNVKVPVHS
ncbi:MAG: hypothetical protein GX090_00790 [Firmicutes bacterium]|nr:hypothetical protein [Bacillota bacterium]